MGSTPITSSLTMPAGMPVASGMPKSAPVNLVDPITSKRLNLDSPFKDRILQLNGRQKLKLALHNTFVTIPSAVYHGLRGDSSYSFSNFLNIAHIPYYLGGAFLAASFAAGRDRVNFVRQAIGVGLYYLGVAGANHGINALYKHKNGIDLDLRYRKSNGDIEKVFASADFPRFDLLSEEDYQRMARKMGVPDNVADPRHEVQENARRIISTSRADKLILGNLLAAVGAGYLARTNAWARLLGNQGVLKAIWTDPAGGNLLNRAANGVLAMVGLVERGIQEKITGYAGETNPLLRKSVLGAVALGAGYTVWHSLNALHRRRDYESPLAMNMCPSMVQPEPTPTEALAKELARGSVFNVFEQARAEASLGGRR